MSSLNVLIYTPVPAAHFAPSKSAGDQKLCATCGGRIDDRLFVDRGGVNELCSDPIHGPLESTQPCFSDEASR